MRHLIRLTALTLALAAAGCGSSSNNSDKGSTQTDGSAGTCQSAGQTALLGSCTANGTCFEQYFTSATQDMITAAQSGCTGSFAATTACPTTGVACKCEQTHGVTRTVTFYTSSAYCTSCTGTCKKVIQ